MKTSEGHYLLFLGTKSCLAEQAVKIRTNFPISQHQILTVCIETGDETSFSVTSWHLMAVSSEFHTPAALPLGKKTLYHLGK
jgi:hypothetical protein